MRVLPGFNPIKGPALGRDGRHSDCSPQAHGSGLSMALFVVLKPAPRRGVSNPPTGARLPGALGLIDASLETVAAHGATASSTARLPV